MIRKAVVFGAGGGIGAALCTALREGAGWQVFEGSRSPDPCAAQSNSSFRFDLLDEQSIASAAREIGEQGPLDLVIAATGLLHGPGIAPEKTYRALDPATMAELFAINAIGPAIIAKHFLPLLARDRRSVFAALSARVGSIGDNRLGGWHSYRASKAALNMLVKNFGIELGRSNKAAIAVALHPGTVDTGLSKPFQGNVPSDRLFSAQSSARHLLAVIEGLEAEHSGKHFDWQGREIPA